MSGQRGFSLLEVLVAFVILALALSALVPALSSLPARSAATTQKWVAQEIALSRLAEVGSIIPLAPGDHGGDWQTWRWRISIQASAMPAPEVRGARPLFEVTATVRDARTETIVYQVTVLRRGRDADP